MNGLKLIEFQRPRSDLNGIKLMVPPIFKMLQVMVTATVTSEVSAAVTMVLAKVPVKIVEASWMHSHVIITDLHLKVLMNAKLNASIIPINIISINCQRTSSLDQLRVLATVRIRKRKKNFLHRMLKVLLTLKVCNFSQKML